MSNDRGEVARAARAYHDATEHPQTAYDMPHEVQVYDDEVVISSKGGYVTCLYRWHRDDQGELHFAKK